MSEHCPPPHPEPPPPADDQLPGPPGTSPAGGDPDAAVEAAEYRYRRALADFDNYRKRTEAQADQRAQEEKRRLVDDLLPVLDHLQLALRHGPVAPADGLAEGVQAVARQLADTLSRHGLEEIPAVDQPFDPEVHEVLDLIDRPDRAPGTVTAVHRPGYRFQGRLLRPALVQVAADRKNKR